jgi:hypothetical protein
MTNLANTIDQIITPSQKKQLAKIPLGDPVLVVLWNDAQLAAVQAANPQHTKQTIVERLIANGAKDPHGTNCLFHFPLANMIQNAREDFLNNAVWVMGTTPGKFPSNIIFYLIIPKFLFDSNADIFQQPKSTTTSSCRNLRNYSHYQGGFRIQGCAILLFLTKEVLQ